MPGNAPANPRIVDVARPLDLMRRVRITAGSPVLAGVRLGLPVSPWWPLLPGGLGLGMAGITGFCGMARLLRVMPWNRALRG